jgi:hypothetical protein
MAAGMGLTPEQRDALLRALMAGGQGGMTDPAQALQNMLQAQGGMSAAQAIVSGLRNRLLPGAGGAGGAGAPTSPALQAARGLSGEEPNYAKIEDSPSGILGEQKPAPKPPEQDLAAKLKEVTDKPAAPAPAGNGILNLPPVPDVPEAGAAVRSAVSGSLRDAARRGQSAMPSERTGPIAITDTITKAALRHGVDPTGLIKTAGIESKFNPGAKNPKSSAGGLFQFVDSTAKRYGLTNKYDAAQSADAAARLWKDNRDILAKSLGREPTNGELYLAHQQGPGGAIGIIKNPNASVAATVGKSAAGLNAGKGLTNRQFADMWTRRMAGTAGRSQLETRKTLGEDIAAPTQAPGAPQASEDVPLPPRRPDSLLSDDKPLTVNVTPSTTESAPTPDTDLGDIGPADQASLGGDDMAGLGDIGGLLGGLDSGDAGTDSGPSQLQEWEQQDAQEEKQPEKPILPEEDKQPGGILSGEGLLGDQAQERADLGRVFSPEGFGGTGLFGRDQGPDPSGFKAPVGLPGAGQRGAAYSPAPGPTVGAPPKGIASITPPQLQSIAPPPPLPPPRPSNEALGLQPPQVDTPTIPTTPLSTPPILRKQDLPGFGTPDGQGRNFGTPNVGARPGLAPPSLTPPSLTPPSLTPPSPAPQPAKPPGILAPQPGNQLGTIASPPPVDPDRMQRDPPAPSWQNPPGILGPGMGGPNPPWQDPPKPPVAQSVLAAPEIDDVFSRLTKGAGLLSGALGQASSQMGAPKKLSGPSPSRPIVDSQPLLTGGLLSNARQGIDLNRFFGLLSGRVG